MPSDRPSAVLPTALPLPVFKTLHGRRIVLASASPRRKDILETAVSETLAAGPDRALTIAGVQARDHPFGIC
jgi:hypothetical protein